MSKFTLKPEFLDCKIITKTDDGTEILVDKFNFTDYYGEMLLKNNQAHLINVNLNWEEDAENKKKTYKQLTPDVILLTSLPQTTEESPLYETSKKPELKPRGRKPRVPKA